MSLQQIAAEMRKYADEHPFVVTSFRPPDPEYRRVLTVDDHEVQVTFTRTVLGGRVFHQLSIGNRAGDPSKTPWAVIYKIKQAFLPDGTQITSPLGNTRQFINALD